MLTALIIGTVLAVQAQKNKTEHAPNDDALCLHSTLPGRYLSQAVLFFRA